MKKKIFLIVPTLGTGGGEKLVIDLAKNIDKNIFDVNIISLYPKQNTLYEKIIEENNINIIYMNKKLGVDFKIVLDIIKLFKQYKPDIVHTHLYVMPYVLPAVILCNTKSRIHTVHSIAEKEADGLLRLIMNIAYKLFKFKPVGICNYVQESIEDVYKIQKDKIACIYNGIDTNIFKYEEIDDNSNDKSINIISTGRMQPVKNHKLMIDAFSEVCSVIPNLKLTILGDGELRSEIEQQINIKEISDKVNLKGVVADVASQLKSSDIYIMTSNYEGLPLSILEAMSCGLPIISTKAGGVVDIVNDGENGILVDINNKQQLIEAMIKLIKDEKLRKNMSQKSNEFSKLYDIKNCTKQYEELYLNAIKNDLL